MDLTCLSFHNCTQNKMVSDLVPAPWSMAAFISAALNMLLPFATYERILVRICAILESQYDFPAWASEYEYCLMRIPVK